MRLFAWVLLAFLFTVQVALADTYLQGNTTAFGYIKPLATGQALGDSSHRWSVYMSSLSLGGTTSQYVRGDGSAATLNTSVVPESANLYFLASRVYAAISGTAPISFNNTTGVFSCVVATNSVAGCLSAADHTTFASAITATIGDVTCSGPGSCSATVAKIQGTTVTGTTGSGASVLGTAPTLSNPVVGTQTLGDSSTKAASTAFVQNALAQLLPSTSVYAASTANIPGTYINAVGGVCVADTFTITATGALSMDGATPSAGDTVLLKNQSSGFQNGRWTVTSTGSLGVSPVLTRASDWDSSADMNSGAGIFVVNGAQANTLWYQSAKVTTCSSDAQVFTQFTGGSGTGPRCNITVTQGNGHGATKTNWRRWSVLKPQVGTCATYADSAANGGSFTINTTAVYTACANDGGTSVPVFGIVVNGTAGSTAINTPITFAQGLRTISNAASSANTGTCWTGILTAGDVLNEQTNGNTNYSDDTVQFALTQIAN